MEQKLNEFEERVKAMLRAVGNEIMAQTTEVRQAATKIQHYYIGDFNFDDEDEEKNMKKKILETKAELLRYYIGDFDVDDEDEEKNIDFDDEDEVKSKKREEKISEAETEPLEERRDSGLAETIRISSSSPPGPMWRSTRKKRSRRAGRTR